jgi:spermidine/putrescine transport system permease protein
VSELVRRYGLGLTLVIAVSTAIWLILLVVLPNVLMVEYSFRPNLPANALGGPDDVYTLGNYAALFSGIDLSTGEIPGDFRVFLRTLWGGALVTAIALVVCYPVAWYLAKVAKPERAALLILLLVIPFWINEILRTFAWYIILSYQGPLNALLTSVGILDAPYRWLSGSGGVLIGMTYAFVLFMMFPLVNALQTLDLNQVEAARDLGAPTWQIHRRIVIPHARPGIAIGCIMVFVLTVSSYIVPAVLGSPGTRWFTQTIYIWFFEGQDWNRGSAYAFVLLALCVVFILVIMRIFRVGLADIAK